MLSSRRGFSTLAEKVRDAAFNEKKAGASVASLIKDNAVDARSEPFKELFVMPKRKLLAQTQIERITGRAQEEKRSRADIHERLAVRKPREKEMREDQDWTAVWPAARSFASSVVPLPVRMGTRRHPEKRAPFKKEGNLELVKIPNFLHLTPAAVEKHCEAIKKFCTAFPPEFTSDPKAAREQVPLTLKYADYVHQGTNIRDNRARVVTMQITLSSLGLTTSGEEKMKRLAGTRYDPSEDMLTITTDRCYTRAQNLDYAYYLLTVLYHESSKVEPWEEMKARQDALRIEFEGSACKERLEQLLGGGEGEDNLANRKQEKIREFGSLWESYMNTEETPEATRVYAEKMKELLRFRMAQSAAPKEDHASNQ